MAEVDGVILGKVMCLALEHADAVIELGEDGEVLV